MQYQSKQYTRLMSKVLDTLGQPNLEDLDEIISIVYSDFPKQPPPQPIEFDVVVSPNGLTLTNTKDDKNIIL